jgi:hypothetical protein
MRKKILVALMGLNLALFGGLMLAPAPAEAIFHDPCCKEDVDGNGFCKGCIWTHDCHSTADCGTIIEA